MKEVSRKFSEEEPESPNLGKPGYQQPVRLQNPAAQDMRFVVKESLNLGFRFLNEFETMLKKMQDDEPEKQS